MTETVKRATEFLKALFAKKKKPAMAVEILSSQYNAEFVERNENCKQKSLIISCYCQKQLRHTPEKQTVQNPELALRASQMDLNRHIALEARFENAILFLDTKKPSALKEFCRLEKQKAKAKRNQEITRRRIARLEQYAS